MNQEVPEVPNEILRNFPNPISKTHIIWDRADCYEDDVQGFNAYTAMGFEPYAVTTELERRVDVQSKAKLQGIVATRTRHWLKRPREIPTELANKVTITATQEPV